MIQKKKKVFVAMSGGVDSSVAAVLLARAGYDVTGVFMKNWSDAKDAEMGECAWKKERRDAAACAAKLDIPFITFDFEKEYRRAVISYLYKEYAAGRTPNPDIMCNRFIKFDLFLKEAIKRGADFIATGHYARIAQSAKRKTQSYHLLAGADKNKDQSYFLYTLGQKELARTLFPLGAMRKPEVRALARKIGLPTADKKDSRGICFIGKVNLKEFLARKIVKKSGKIITTDGRVVGKHDGIFYYTIGQRHGLGIGGGAPYYVAAKNARANTLIVGHVNDPRLFKKELTVSKSHWVSGAALRFPLVCLGRIRYRARLAVCRVESAGKNLRVIFKKPQRAVTPGQFVVFYKGEEVLGGGVID